MNWAGLSIAVGLFTLAIVTMPYGILILILIAMAWVWSKG